MTYKTLGGGLRSVPVDGVKIKFSALDDVGRGRFGGIFKGFWGRIFEHPEVKTANIAIWREKSRFLWR